MSKRSRAGSADFLVLRWGLLIFVAFVIWQTLAGLFSTSLPLLEPFGFAVFLTTLGYVAASRTLRRDQQLKEIRKELEVARRIQLSHFAGRISPFNKLPSSRKVCTHDCCGRRFL